MGFLIHKPPKAQTPNQQFVNGVMINKACYGDTIPVLLGPNRVPMSLIGLWDFLRTAHVTPGATAGKGIGGGSSPASTSYSYSTAFQALLGFGPMDHLDGVWTSSGKVSSQQISSDFTVPGGGGHVDFADPGFIGDSGVGLHVAYSQPVNDFGAGGGLTLAGTYQTPMVRGAVAAHGVYTVTTPSAGVTRYTFHSSDAGAVVTINYSSNFAYVEKSVEIVVPGGLTFSLADSNFIGWTWVTDTSNVRFPGPAPVTPPAGEYSCDNSGNFTFNSADAGKTLFLHYQAKDPNTDAAVTLNYNVSLGTDGQSVWSYLTTSHPEAAFAYNKMLTVQSADLELGSGGAMPQLSFNTVHAKYMAGSGIAGCNPADVVLGILTDPDWGVNFPSARIGDWSNAKAFWAANGFFIALKQDNQSTGMDVIKSILDAGQGAFFWADDGTGVCKLQLAVYGDTSAAGFGQIFQPDTQPVVEFSVDDMVASGGSEPLKLQTTAENNIYNRVKVEYLNALMDYNAESIVEDEPAQVQLAGVHEEGQQSWHFIRYSWIAQLAANLRVKRMANIRDTYSYTVTTRYRPLLKLMKLVTVTWSAMGWTQKPMRLTSMEDSHTGLVLTLEEFPYGIAKPTLYPKQSSAAVAQNPALINPGDCSVVAMELPDLFTGYAGYTVRIWGNPFTPDNWGGGEVYLAADGTNYAHIGTVREPAILGTLGGSGMTAGSGDPDTQSITVVMDSNVQIPPVTTYDFANHNALLAIIDASGDFEIVAYSTRSLTGANQYSVSTFHRGLFGTARVSHSAGAKVLKVDEGFVDYQYQVKQVGQTVGIKIASFNRMQVRLQDPSTLTPITFVLSGSFPGFFDRSTGMTSRFSMLPADCTYRPLTNPLTAHDAGSNATVNLAAFTMRVARSGDISLSSGAISGLAYDTLYYIYYDDLLFAGGAVTYHADTVKEAALNGPARFYVGSIMTPKAGAIDTIGFNDGGTGAQTGMHTILSFLLAGGTANLGNGTVTTPGNQIDNDPTTFSVYTVTGNSGSNRAASGTGLGVTSLKRRFASLTLEVIFSVTTNSLNGAAGNRIIFSTPGFANFFTLGPGVTAALQRATLSLPLSINLAQLQVTILSSTLASDTTGSLVLNVFDISVRGIE